MITAGRAACVALLAGLLIAAGPALGEKRYGPGVTDTEIKIGQTMPYSGPASANGNIGKAMVAYFAKLNDEGGINGRKVTLLSLDDAYTPPRTVEQTRKLVEQENVLLIFGTLGTATNTAIHKYLNANKVPHIFITTGMTRWGDPKNYPWTMGWQPTLQTEARIHARYILTSRPDARIAVLYQNDDFGKEMLAGLKAGLGDKAGKMILAEVSYEVTDPTIDQQIIALQASGADTLLHYSLSRYSAQAIRKAYDMGWKPQHILAIPAGSIAQTLKVAGVEKSIGALTATFMKDVNDPNWANDRAGRDFFAFMKQYLPAADPYDERHVQGYTQAQTLAQVLKQCGDDLTRRNIMRQAASLKNLELPLLLPGITINTSPSDYYPLKQMQMMRFDGTHWVAVGGILGGESAGR
jgi:branched-chain amino acid transport system substrate-binding protein